MTRCRDVLGFSLGLAQRTRASELLVGEQRSGTWLPCSMACLPSPSPARGPSAAALCPRGLHGQPGLVVATPSVRDSAPLMERRAEPAVRGEQPWPCFLGAAERGSLRFCTWSVGLCEGPLLIRCVVRGTDCHGQIRRTGWVVAAFLAPADPVIHLRPSFP